MYICHEEGSLEFTPKLHWKRRGGGGNGAAGRFLTAPLCDIKETDFLNPEPHC